jgi:hypothetical protein
MIVTGVSGTINLEVSNDGGATWCQIVKSFKMNASDQVDDFVAGMMRVNATTGGASEVQIVAERAIARASAIPNAPSNGPGASLDVTSFGCETTVVVAGFSGVGSINVEISGDDSEWSTAFSFNKDGCETKNISAKFIRVNGNDATATVSLASVDSPAIVGEPLTTFVFRPGATGDDAPGGNVYTDEDAIIAALTATANDGKRVVEFDARYSPHSASIGGTRPVCRVTKQWPMENVAASSHHGLGGTTPIGILFGLSLTIVEFKDGGCFKELSLIDGIELFFLNSNLAAGSGVVPIPLPANGIVGSAPPPPFDKLEGAQFVIRGEAVGFGILDPLATNMFEVQDAPGAAALPFAIIHMQGALNSHFGLNYFGPAPIPLAKPLVDVPTGRRCNILVGAGSVASDAFEGGGDVSIVPYGAGAISDSFNPMTQPLICWL